MIAETSECTNFRAYHLRDGLIGPRPSKSPRRYDVWAAHAAAQKHDWTIDVPYRGILELGRALRKSPARWSGAHGALKLNLAVEATDAVLKFCSQYGLLGLFPIQAQRFAAGKDVEYRQYAGRWFAAPPERGTDGGSVDFWEWEEFPWGWAAAGPYTDPGTEISCVPFRLSADIDLDLARWQAETEGPPAFAPLFFPNVPAEQRHSFRYPQPDTPEFWQIYHEPLHLFAGMVLRFLRSVEIVAGIAPDEHSGSQINSALDFLNGLADHHHGRITFDQKGNQYQREHHAPGVLAHFATMFLVDWESGRQVNSCGTCGSMFVSSDSRAKYCSERCRKTMMMRRYRSSKRTAAEEINDQPK